MFTIEIEREDDGRWIAEVADLPGVIAYGESRQQAIDRVQEIVWQQEPFIYLVNKDSMSAVAKSLHNAHPVVLRPQVYWNIDQLTIGTEGKASR